MTEQQPEAREVKRLQASAAAADALIREILESLCRRDGLPMESSVVPGEPARNYDLAMRLGIGHVFGISGGSESHGAGTVPKDTAQALPSAPEPSREALGASLFRSWHHEHGDGSITGAVTGTAVQPPAACSRCEGCGQLADTDDREPWTAWTSLPLEAQVAVRLGIVKPVPCDVCGGTGRG